MRKQEGRKQRQASAGKSCDLLDEIMISPLVSKVNPSHLADFAALRDCSAVEAAPAARLKALSSAHNCSENSEGIAATGRTAAPQKLSSEVDIVSSC